MKKLIITLYVIILLSLLVACVSNNSTQDTSTDADKIATIVAGTLSAIPTVTLVPVPSTPAVTLKLVLSTPTDIPVQALAPLYSEITWENLGRSEQEVSVNWLTNERITLAGYTYQAPFPVEKMT